MLQDRAGEEVNEIDLRQSAVDINITAGPQFKNPGTNDLCCAVDEAGKAFMSCFSGLAQTWWVQGAPHGPNRRKTQTILAESREFVILYTC